MPFDADRIRGWLRAFQFGDLFRLGLGWDNVSRTLDVAVTDQTFRLSAIAHKRGYTAWLCDSIPDRATRLKIDHKVTKSSQEHFIVYADRDKGRQIWQWVRRQPGEPIACRERQLDVGQPGDRLIQSLQAIQFRLDQEERLGLAEVLDQVEQAFKAERVTRRFYERFKTEHTKFREFITGISDDGDLGWYTSITLNRLMFVYFIQKKGFLDGNVNYLRDRLEKVRAARGRDRFQSFFRYFLLRLFHDGLGKTKADRKLDATLGALLGDVPYLNGGFFEVHQLEKANKEIDIPDAAFVALFDFFDQYEWHLDDRPLREDNEINPDVIGYIFEKYINQKQMGAYYTKEDITEYICKSTIIPFLFDAARAKCAIAFEGGSSLWKLLSNDPDRYIYPAVRQGVIDGQGEVLPLPAEIAAGLDNVSARDGWNAAATEPYGLPTETWREHVARRQRCLRMREQLAAGDVHDIQDVVTLNLDIWQLARDAIVNAEGPELLRAFWQAIGTVTVLDPTCGSGAFLFAALRILESLYGDCVERMEQFLDERDSAKAAPDRYQDFKRVVEQIQKHPNARYFFLKSIILNNLYGVDIMEEAVEICKLRLFLKLVAEVDRADRIEPLPDIDFNIQAGNTLIGFASLEQLQAVRQGKLGFDDEDVAEIVDQTDIVDKAFKQFRLQQTTHGGRVTREDKEELRSRLAGLNATLDKYLAAEYGIAVSKRQELATWKASHKPFHWFVEFYGIMRQGGFDVVVGNPPYVKMSDVRKMYTLRGYRTDTCTDVYAACLERVAQLANCKAYTGMIVMLSLAFSRDFRELRSVIYSSYQTNWFSSFGRIPAALFAHDVRVRNTIHLGAKAGPQRSLTTRLHRWFEEERGHLLSTMSYAPFSPGLWQGLVPKLNTPALVSAFEAASRRGRKMSHFFGERSAREILYFKQSAYNWLTFCREMPPCYDASGKAIRQTQFGKLAFDDARARDIAFALLNTKLQLAYWIAVGDDFHLATWMFGDLPLDVSRLAAGVTRIVEGAVRPLEDAMKAATSFKLNAGKRVGNYNLARCRGVTDVIDHAVCEAAGFGDVMEDIELLYVQVIRTNFGDDEDGGEDEDK